MAINVDNATKIVAALARPKLVKGAFIEYGEQKDPLYVVFQFNPVQLSRNKQLSYLIAGESGASEEPAARNAPNKGERSGLRALHQRTESLSEIREQQQVEIQEETIGFELRLDATDKMNAATVDKLINIIDPEEKKSENAAMKFSIVPELAALELMAQPKIDRYLDAVGDKNAKPAHSFTKGDLPPLIIFSWGDSRVLPVNIQSLSITETEFDAALNPIRATVQVSLMVIEGKNAKYVYSQKLKSQMARHYLNNNGEQKKEIRIP